MLTQLHNAGKLERVRGIVIGELYKSAASAQLEPWLRSRSMEDVFEHHLEPLGVPIIHNLPLGHGKHLWTLPLGVSATVDADARALTIAEAALAASSAPRQHAAAQAASR